MDTSYSLFIVLMFVAVVLALEGAYTVWASKSSAEAKRLASRLRQLEGTSVETPVTIERKPAERRWSWIEDGLITSLPKGVDLQTYVETSGTGRSVSEMVIYSAGLGVVGALLPFLWGKLLVFSVLLGVVLAATPWFWLAHQRKKRIELFERQIPEALDLMGRALRAGHAFPTAVKMVGDEMADPIGKEFRILFDETNYGIPQNEALLRMADRVPVEDLRYFVVAVMIQRESGGNLAELLDKIASIVRARLTLLGEVRTLSAEGRMSAWVLAVLPFAVALVVNILNPSFMAVLWTDPMGLRMVGGALAMMVLGIWWMRKIIQIRV
jgi:tight adherence protein B